MPTPRLKHSNLLAAVPHAFTTRTGGSTRVYLADPAQADGELNLGFTQEDDGQTVLHNRATLVSAIPGAWKLVTLRQTHTAHIEVLRDPNHVFIAADGRATLTGDGLITHLPGLLLAIQTADCIPVLAYDPVQKVVAGFHAGWRGTAAGIVEKGIARMQQEYGTRPGDVVAAIGPGIGPSTYAVSEDLRTRFRTGFDYADELFQAKDGELLLNLWEANRRQLLHAGVPVEKIDLLAECTFSKPDRYFSHRRDQGVSGRMMSVIGLPANQ